MFIDDGKGYIELGKDALYDFDDDRSLLKMKDMTWIVASADNENWQFVPYYHLYATDDGEKTIYTGRIPVRLNGDYADLLVNIDDEDMNVVGYTYDYLSLPRVCMSLTKTTRSSSSAITTTMRAIMTMPISWVKN